MEVYTYVYIMYILWHIIFVYILYILWHIMYLLYVYTITDLARTQMIDGSEGSHEVFDLLNHVAGQHAV